MVCILLFFFSFPGFVQAAQNYTLNDLEVLVQEEGHEEFFEHALDIRPSERQDAWKGMVSKMGDSFARKILQKSEVQRKDFQTIETLYLWPGLKQDDVFKLKRQEIGLRFFRQCIKKEVPCWDDIKSFWEKDKTDADTAYKLAELTVGYKDSPFSTWTFLDVALKSTLSEFYCKKEFVLQTLWGKIEMDYIQMGPEGDLMKKIDQTIHPDCLPYLITEARKKILRPLKTHDRELSYQILKSQMKADETITDFFYTVYLLDNPSQGELFNLSWNRIKELGGKSLRRERILEKLKTLDPLPDQIFSSFDQLKKKTILHHFKNYFPEYLDFYADQCVKFYGGKGSFPQGNPTVHCQDLMNAEYAPKVISEDKIKRYLEVKKI